MTRLTKIALALSLALPACGVFAAQPVPTIAAAAPAVQTAATGAHLGVGVEAVPPVLAAQLPYTVPQGQGVLIGRVEPGSPAAAAGLQAYDILLSYGDQKLFSPDQLSALVAHQVYARYPRVRSRPSSVRARRSRRRHGPGRRGRSISPTTPFPPCPNSARRR